MFYQFSLKDPKTGESEYFDFRLELAFNINEMHYFIKAGREYIVKRNTARESGFLGEFMVTISYNQTGIL